MDSTLPDSILFKVLSLSALIPIFKASNCITITVSIILLIMQAFMQYTLRQDIFAFVGKPVLMVLDCVAIIGPLFSHILLIMESVLKKKTDLTIWRQINDINKAGGNSSSLDKTFHRDFIIMLAVPFISQGVVIFATYRTQKNWALGLISSLFSGVINRCGILVFFYYVRFMSNRISLLTQEIEHLLQLTKNCKYEGDIIAGRFIKMKTTFNMVWRMHTFVKNRYEIFLVTYFFLSLCGLTASMYFLGTRLVTRRFPYTLESAISLVPYLYTHIHLSMVAADFVLEQTKLLDALESLSEKNWKNPQVISAIKSFIIELKLANLTPTVGGHLKIQFPSIVLGVIYIVITNVFLFLFLN